MTMIESESFVWMDIFTYKCGALKLLHNDGYMSQLFTQFSNICCITRQFNSVTMLQKQQRKEEATQKVINKISFGFSKQTFPSAENKASY